MQYGTPAGQPVGGYDPRIILDADDDSRTSLMRQMGVANLDPPLPHAPCLKVIKTGVIHPWNHLLAAQRDLVVCCDENGNEDPSAWEPRIVPKDEETSQQELAALAQQQIIIRKDAAAQQNESFLHPMPSPNQLNNDGKTEYERQGVVSYNEIESLRAKLRG